MATLTGAVTVTLSVNRPLSYLRSVGTERLMWHWRAAPLIFLTGTVMGRMGWIPISCQRSGLFYVDGPMWTGLKILTTSTITFAIGMSWVPVALLVLSQHCSGIVQVCLDLTDWQVSRPGKWLSHLYYTLRLVAHGYPCCHVGYPSPHDW